MSDPHDVVEKYKELLEYASLSMQTVIHQLAQGQEDVGLSEGEEEALRDVFDGFVEALNGS